MLWLTCCQNIKEGIDGHAAAWYSDVFALVFPDVDPAHANNVWKAQLATSEKEGAPSDEDGP